MPKSSEYQLYRAASPGRTGSNSSMPIYVAAAMIALAILLSTLITAVTSRYVGFEGSTEENMWLVDRMTGSVYRCRAPEPGRASCEAEMATGSVTRLPKR